MNQECYRIVFFDQGVSKTRHLRIYKRTFYLIAFLLFFLAIFLCDYIQIRRQAFDLNRARQEVQLQKSQIQFFTMRIEDLEGQLSKLMDFDKKIRVIANLEQNQDKVSFIGTGGIHPNNRRANLETE